MRLTQEAARTLMLAAQGLDARPRKKATKRDVLATIRRMGALQIDTISVVARSPYLVLWSRLGDFPLHWLEELLAEGKLFEYWAHEACFLPVEDFALFRHRMLEAAGMGWRYSRALMAKRDEVERLLATVRERGPVRSADFERTDGKAGGWWEWKPEKRMLESLFTAGELMIARRERFQRVYDLRERVLPGWDDALLPAREDADRALVLNSVRALGVARPRWVADYFRMPKRAAPAVAARLADEGALLRVEVEGWPEPAYIHPEHRATAERASAGEIRPRLTTLLSPFDPLVWDRARGRELWGFDYRLECYTPAPKRRFGYFVLPVLRRGALVGRLDPKAHRREGVFEVRALYLEPGVRVTGALVDDLARALRECAAWHGTPEVALNGSDPPGLAARLRAALAAAG
ncbi:MAG TPA: crosslink repair DNA glycosylase YcaQ family protein [Longimicrobiaceae bacterium]|nr:crosslink repair DNA glycosylase YcaQ family protein [Longimicrobiaceae bacterium]